MASRTGAGKETLRAEVAYATPGEQVVLSVESAPGATVETVIRRSGVLERFPGIDLHGQKVGIFSRPVALDTPVRDGDRVEIYRPLRADPKEMRRERARHERS